MLPSCRKVHVVACGAPCGAGFYSCTPPLSIFFNEGPPPPPRPPEERHSSAAAKLMESGQFYGACMFLKLVQFCVTVYSLLFLCAAGKRLAKTFVGTVC